MKTGKNLQELAQEIMRQQQTKKDFIVPTGRMILLPSGEQLFLEAETKQFFDVTSMCHQQIGDKIGIPRKYYERMLQEAPSLLSNNVNHWLREKPEKRMLRTMDGKARAFLSGRYRRLDNYDLLETVLPIVQEQECNIVSCDVTDKKLYLKVVSPKIEAEVKKGDVVQAGIVVSNSEIGMGTLTVSPLVYRLICLNGQIMADSSLRKTHLGRNQEGDGVFEMLTDATKIANDRAFWMKVKDVIAHAISQVWFDKTVNRMTIAAQQRIKKPITESVKVLSNQFSFNQNEQSSVLENIIREGDYTKWGLSNAVTRMSQNVEDYDRATELEVIGGQIIDLSPDDWKEVALI